MFTIKKFFTILFGSLIRYCNTKPCSSICCYYKCQCNCDTISSKHFPSLPHPDLHHNRQIRLYQCFIFSFIRKKLTLKKWLFFFFCWLPLLENKNVCNYYSPEILCYSGCNGGWVGRYVGPNQTSDLLSRTSLH